MWAELQADWSATADAIVEASARVGAESSRDEEISAMPTGGEDVLMETKTRRGQELFRAAVLSAYQNRCCITGVADARLLNASHIVPWREDPENRLNPRNGLCLNALHDRAFDRGLITFDADLRLLLSPQLAQTQNPFVLKAFGAYHGQQIELPEKFTPDLVLMQHHRERIFVGA